MKVPLEWLAEYVSLKLPPAELAHRLTMAGVEASYHPGASAGWEQVLIGRVAGLGPHPNAQRLRLATVDVGGESITVVCGAPNIAEGQRIAFARVGARLTDPRTGQPFTLAAASIRGVVSGGMVCSERELGLGDDHDGILVLPDDAPVGRPLTEYMRDDLLELEVKANRGDCLSMLGVAHEVGAIAGEGVYEPSLEYRVRGPDVSRSVKVTVEDPELCSRYLATVVRGVQVKPSPDWMQRRLTLAGMRPINNVVDVTNYVMLEYGQPLHAFDLGAVRGQHIIVRAARQGERLVALDGQEHVLQPPMLVIADPERSIGLAGVMGAANSEMSEATTDVLIESATFDPINTRRTSQALRLRSEASVRFEKGLSPELAMRAVRRATALVLETAGGEADAGVAEDYPRPVESRAIPLRLEKASRLLGADLGAERIAGALISLGMQVEPAEARGGETGMLLVTPPYWRNDISIEEDVIEEAARTIGYDAIPAEPMAGHPPSFVPQRMRVLKHQTKDLLVALGLQEIVSYSLVSERLMGLAPPSAIAPSAPDDVTLAATGPLRMANPMSQEQQYLRTTLRGGVLRSLATNLRQAQGGLGLFEMGRVYWPRREELPEEREMVFGTMAGTRGGTLWSKGASPIDFYDAKGVVLALLRGIGVQAELERGMDILLHPGRAARVLVGGRPVGVVGELHPQALAGFDFPRSPVACFELDLQLLLGEASERKYQYSPFTRFPSADRDLALVVDDSVPAEELDAIIGSHPLVRQATLFDLFSGSPLPPGKKSLAYHVELQSDKGTLSTEEVNGVMDVLVRRLEEVGAMLRG